MKLKTRLNLPKQIHQRIISFCCVMQVQTKFQTNIPKLKYQTKDFVLKVLKSGLKPLIPAPIENLLVVESAKSTSTIAFRTPKTLGSTPNQSYDQNNFNHQNYKIPKCQYFGFCQKIDPELLCTVRVEKQIQNNRNCHPCDPNFLSLLFGVWTWLQKRFTFLLPSNDNQSPFLYHFFSFFSS